MRLISALTAAKADGQATRLPCDWEVSIAMIDVARSTNISHQSLVEIGGDSANRLA
jgi:hypothetical protein